MLFSKDMVDLLEIFERIGVQYVLVGGYAVNYYGYIRTTQDIDLLVYPSTENARKVMISLTEFGFGEAGIPQAYFEKTGSAVHLGVEPNRIDLLTHLKDVANDQIFTNMKRVELEGVPVNIISLPDLIESKRRSDRPRDRADAEELERTENEKQE
mgnify:CR=1 FL=1